MRPSSTPATIAAAVPAEHRAEVAELLERILAAFPDRGKRAQALAEVADLLRARS